MGTAKGNVSVFDGEDKSEFLISESDKLHDGAVTALLFEPDELRFLSAGADQKLLSTHARGRRYPDGDVQVRGPAGYDLLEQGVD